MTYFLSCFVFFYWFWKKLWHVICLSGYAIVPNIQIVLDQTFDIFYGVLKIQSLISNRFTTVLCLWICNSSWNTECPKSNWIRCWHFLWSHFCVNLSYPPCKDGNSLFTTVPFKALDEFSINIDQFWKLIIFYRWKTCKNNQKSELTGIIKNCI